MQALYFAGQRKLEWRDVPMPTIQGDGQAVVRPIASTTCDLDHRIIAGLSPFEPPFALGHEAVAEVVDVGSGVRSIRPGDLVVVPWHICCGECANCRAGLSGHCQSVRPVSAYGVPVGGHWGGLFSDSVLVPYANAMLVKLPRGIDPVAAASVSDNLTDAYINVRKGMERHPGARVLVIGGTGCLGPFAVDNALAAGAEAVDYVDKDETRRNVARSLGATVYEAMLPEFQSSYHVVVSGTRDKDDLRAAFLALKPGGHLSGMAIYFRDTEVPLWDMFLRDITFSTGLPSVRSHIPDVLSLVESGKLRPRQVVSSIVEWNDAALALLEPSLKPVVVRARAFVEA